MGLRYGYAAGIIAPQCRTRLPPLPPRHHPFPRMICPAAAAPGQPSPTAGNPVRVSISHHDVQRGLFFKRTYYEVRLSIAFSHEEKQIIRQRRLGPTKLLDRRPATAAVDDRDEKFELHLADLLDARTDRFLCATPSAAKIYEEDLLKVLEQVKRWLADNAETGGGTVVEF